MTGTIATTALTNADLAPAATPITTGAAPVDADFSVRLYAITTGGTGGVEIINLPPPDLPVDGYANPGRVGQRIGFYIETLTDPGDSVKLQVNGSDTITVYPTGFFGNASVVRTTTGVIMDFVGAFATMIWAYDFWLWEVALGDGNDSTIMSTLPLIIHAGKGFNANGGDAGFGGGDATGSGSGGVGQFSGGNENNGAGAQGGAVICTGSGSGQGGSVTLQPGTGTTGISGNVTIARAVGGTGDGQVLVSNLPTSDPAVLNALWNNAGTLKISAG